MIKIGIIAGSGCEELSPFCDWESSAIETSYGVTEVREGAIDGREIVFAARHGRGHKLPPHRINYRAIIAALRELGAKRAIGTAAVGSMSTELQPGTAAVLTDFIDYTRSGPITLFDEHAATVVHTDFSEPYCPELSAALLSASEQSGLEVTTPCTYVCVDGPRYETPAEITMFRRWGGDVVGMTNVPEAILAREAGICYGAVAIITNYAAGISPTPLSHEDVVAMMSALQEKLAATIIAAVRSIPFDRNCGCPGKAMSDEG